MTSRPLTFGSEAQQMQGTATDTLRADGLFLDLLKVGYCN